MGKHIGPHVVALSSRLREGESTLRLRSDSSQSRSLSLARCLPLQTTAPFAAPLYITEYCLLCPLRRWRTLGRLRMHLPTVRVHSRLADAGTRPFHARLVLLCVHRTREGRFSFSPPRNLTLRRKHCTGVRGHDAGGLASALSL